MPEFNYLKSECQCKQNAADAHQCVSSCDEHFPSQTFNEHTL